MATTPIYGFRYQSLGDAPDGPDLGGDLAADVEAKFVTTDAAIAAINGLSWAIGAETTPQAAYSGFTFNAGAQSCAAAFTAPSSGSVTLYWKADFISSINDKMALVGCELRSGAAIGGGSVVVPANSTDTIGIAGSVTSGVPLRFKGSTFKLITGLVAGNAYHARVMYQTETGGNITVNSRQVLVMPNL